jgi:L-threonylcarbamoyladenylate synthase
MCSKNLTERLDPDEKGIARAVDLLLAGRLVAVPTETVYGLATRADSPEAVARIFEAKGRPDFNPLIVHVRDAGMAQRFATWDDRAQALAERFWSGPLTMVLPLRKDAGLAPAVSAGLPTVALRCPAHPVMQQLIERAGVPMAAPSANRSGFVSPTSAAHVLETLDGRIDAVIDGGPTERGLESTIVALRDFSELGGWQLLRPGPVTRDELVAVLGEESGTMTGAIEAPGQLASHYAPGKPVRLDAMEARPGEFFIGFGKTPGDCTLSAAGDIEEAAARLYDCLHLAAGSDKVQIAVAPIPHDGVGAAINDRLKRAAA